MHQYEFTAILRNKDVDALTEKVKGILTKNGAKILSEDSPGLRKLAYQIGNEAEGFYLFMILEVPSDAIAKINKEFKLNVDILRYLFVRIKKAESA
jgi:small subunit ribosomal protein S6